MSRSSCWNTTQRHVLLRTSRLEAQIVLSALHGDMNFGHPNMCPKFSTLPVLSPVQQIRSLRKALEAIAVSPSSPVASLDLAH